MNNGIKSLFFKNIANIITAIGLILCVWLVVVMISDPECLWLILILAGLIGLSDLLDGIVARYLKIKSDFGSALDRLRDKIFICPTLIILFCHYWRKTFQSLLLGTLSATLVIGVIFIESLLLFAWFLGLSKKLDVGANRYGQIKMFLQFIAVIIWLISLAIEKYCGLPVVKFSIYLIDVILAVTIYYGLKSLDGYYQRYYKNNNQITKDQQLKADNQKK